MLLISVGTELIHHIHSSVRPNLISSIDIYATEAQRSVAMFTDCKQFSADTFGNFIHASQGKD